MSDLNGHPSTSGQAKAGNKFVSLADILNTKSSTSGVKTRSADKLQQLQLKLQKDLDGVGASSSKLNLSRAFNLDNTSTFDFVDPNTIEQNNQLETERVRQESAQLNRHLLNERHHKSNRRPDGRPSRREDPSGNITSLSAFGDDPKVQIEKLISRIDNKNACFDFDDKNKNGFGKTKTPGFNFIQLPKDFSLERSRVNVYKSGIIEVVTNDAPPKVMRFKPTVHGINNVYTDLVITTESQVYMDQMNVCTPETFEQS